MKSDILNTIYLACSFIVLFAAAELLYHRFMVRVELTRKLVHFGTGLLTLLFPIMLGNHWLVLLLCAGFTGILLVSLRFNYLPSINAIDRVSAGSLCYPGAVYICYLVFDHYSEQYIYFYLPMLSLAVCDPVAALTGKRWPLGKYRIGRDNKTFLGSFMFFLSCFLLSLVLFIVNHWPLSAGMLLACLVLSLVCAAAEAVTTKGFDNLSIPLTSLLMMILINETGAAI